MINSKVKTYIGFAIKSNKVIWGLDNLLTTKKIPYLIVIDNTLGEVSSRKLQQWLDKNNIPKVEIDEPLAGIFNKQNCKLIGIRNKELANAIINIMQN
ncbi:MAG: hypothetical protein RR454_01475 [Clostridia bacterium]